jgi:hypothetical protein
MNKQRGLNIGSLFYNGLLILVLVVTGSCGENPVESNNDGENNNGNNGNGGESISMVEGEVEGYDLGANDLYEGEDFVDLIEGSINEDGTFTVNFLDKEDIQEALKPLGDDEYVGMYCRENISSNLGDDHLFVDVSLFNFTFGENNNVGAIALSSGSTNRNSFPPQSDNSGEYQVRWIFSSEQASISESCEAGSGGTNEVDIELTEGWNEVIFDLSEPDTKKMYTGERPDQADWVLDT